MTGNKAFAAMHAGMSRKSNNVDRALKRPAVRDEVVRIQTERLFNDALPLAVSTLCAIMGDEKAPAGARVNAAKIALDRTIGAEEANAAKEPHEMTANELNVALEQARLRAAALETVAADRARPVLELDPEPINESAPEVDLFD